MGFISKFDADGLQVQISSLGSQLQHVYSWKVAEGWRCVLRQAV